MAFEKLARTILMLPVEPGIRPFLEKQKLPDVSMLQAITQVLFYGDIEYVWAEEYRQAFTEYSFKGNDVTNEGLQNPPKHI